LIVDVVICSDCGDVGALAGVVAALPASLVRDVYVVASGPVAATRARLLASARGVGAQLERAREHLCALQHPPDVAAFLSPDGSDDPAELARLLAPLAAGAADLVLGSRGGHLAERAAALLIRLVYHQRYHDLSPFRAIRLHAWVALGLRERGHGGFAEMQIKAARAQLRVVEVPVQPRKSVRLPLGARLSAWLGTSWRVSYLLLRYATAR
jgi:hypothetical protein